ncbi:hypothetical protein T4E_9978 [Trichinella pseudospiralis]|uniref:Uncharacterized protein n=1 Tax=Trichinella pseudospiralis TaxID=6337 RepID=A0A0V0XNG5_TRIPS|nr:hypothetical protein T4E_9978 [Trichinella pseudospiralis]
MQIFICPGAVPEGKAWGYILKNSKFLVFCLRHSLGHGLRASKNLHIPPGYTLGLIKICINPAGLTSGKISICILPTALPEA